VEVMRVEELAKNIIKAQENVDLQLGLERSIINFSNATTKVLNKFPDLIELAEYVRTVKEKVLNDLDYYIDQTIKNINATGAYAYFANDRESLLKIIDNIIGKEKRLIIKAKSMVTEEIMLREYLNEKGHEVYETDLGELLIQIAKEKPMHTIAPAVHLTKERAAQLLEKLGLPVNKEMKHEELVFHVRKFLREKFINADIGISGANAIAADSGAIFLIHNEGNISNVVTLPPIHIVITGVEKIMPTFKDAIYQVMVQSGYAGLYPPTYVNIISGPSSTADIEYHRVYGVHGAKEVHVILFNGGRINALNNPILREQLRCIRCGRCQIVCPIWDLSGNIWGGRVYGGPMGIGWTAITESIENAVSLSWFCLLCNACKEACPVKIDIPQIVRFLRAQIKSF
jgi:L-lactate dehydrogenase complex protein LldG